MNLKIQNLAVFSKITNNLTDNKIESKDKAMDKIEV